MFITRNSKWITNWERNVIPNLKDPVPEEKKNISEYEDVSCLLPGEILMRIRVKDEMRWKRRGQEPLHVKENKARNLVPINIKYVEYFEFVKERVIKYVNVVENE